MLQKRFLSAFRKSYQLKHKMDSYDVLPFNQKNTTLFSSFAIIFSCFISHQL